MIVQIPPCLPHLHGEGGGIPYAMIGNVLSVYFTQILPPFRSGQILRVNGHGLIYTGTRRFRTGQSFVNQTESIFDISRWF